MFTMILLLYLQQNLDVVLEGSSLRGEFASKAQCEQAAARLRGALPTPEGHSAAWQDVLCVPIARDVQVRQDGPGDLARLLRERTPADCGADGAWRRVAESCMPAASPAKPSPPVSMNSAARQQSAIRAHHQLTSAQSAQP